MGAARKIPVLLALRSVRRFRSRRLSMKLRAKYLAGAGAAALFLAAGSLQARADDTTEAILKRLDALENENSKLKAEIKRIETKAPAKSAAAKPPQEVTPASAQTPSAFLEPPGTIVEV